MIMKSFLNIEKLKELLVIWHLILIVIIITSCLLHNNIISTCGGDIWRNGGCIIILNNPISMVIEWTETVSSIYLPIYQQGYYCTKLNLYNLIDTVVLLLLNSSIIFKKS